MTSEQLRAKHNREWYEAGQKHALERVQALYLDPSNYSDYAGARKSCPDFIRDELKQL